MTIKNICNNCQVIIAGPWPASRGTVIYSYGTPVMAIDHSGMKPRLVRLWDGWSATTQRHINKVLDYLGRPHINKAIWDKMEIENL